MTRDELLAGLRDIMKSNSPTTQDWDAVAESDTIESLGFDSLAMLDLAYDVQNDLGIDIQIEALMGVKTVGELVDRLLAIA